jgi:hypothetical protein
MTIGLRVNYVPISTLAAFMEACAVHPSAGQADLATFAGFSPGTAKKAIPSLQTLGIVYRDGDGVYRIAVDGVGRGMKAESGALVVRRALQGLRAFEMLCEGLALGEDVPAAKRKTALLLGLSERDADGLDVLLRWGTDLGMFEYGENGLQLVAELRASVQELAPMLSADDLESEAKARLYNAKNLGRDANNYLDETDRQLLADALIAYVTNPRKSLENSGQAFEDFLREIANDNGLAGDAKKANGIGQLGNLLYTKGVIHNHHQKLADGISTARNATAHRKDKKTLTPWTITALGAFSVHSMTLAVIRSIHGYITKGRQVL